MRYLLAIIGILGLAACVSPSSLIPRDCGSENWFYRGLGSDDDIWALGGVEKQARFYRQNCGGAFDRQAFYAGVTAANDRVTYYRRYPDDRYGYRRYHYRRYGYYDPYDPRYDRRGRRGRYRDRGVEGDLDGLKGVKLKDGVERDDGDDRRREGSSSSSSSSSSSGGSRSGVRAKLPKKD